LTYSAREHSRPKAAADGIDPRTGGAGGVRADTENRKGKKFCYTLCDKNSAIQKAKSPTRKNNRHNRQSIFLSKFTLFLPDTQFTESLDSNVIIQRYRAP
jgi:hypothetical protein